MPAPTLTISKSVAGNTDGVQDNPLIKDDDGGPAPRANIADTLTFTLDYTLANGPVTGATIVDVLPKGYSAPTSISNGGVFADGTITWTFASSRGQWVRQLPGRGAPGGERPRPAAREHRHHRQRRHRGGHGTTQPVVVAGVVEAATATPRVTPPPTDTASIPATDASGNVLLVILALIGLVAVLGILTPSPARARRRSRRG